MSDDRDDVDEVDEAAGGDEGTALVRHLRTQLKEANKRAAAAEARLEGAVSGDEAAALRERAGELVEDRWGKMVAEVGVPARWAEMIRDQVPDDAILDSPADVQAWLADLGSDLGDRLPQATQDRIAAQRSIDDARNTAVPSLGARMTVDGLTQMMESGDSAGALSAWRSGGGGAACTHQSADR